MPVCRVTWVLLAIFAALRQHRPAVQRDKRIEQHCQKIFLYIFNIRATH